MAEEDKRNRWTDKEIDEHVLEVTRLLRADPTLAMKDALFLAQRDPVIAESRRKEKFTGHMMKAQIARAEAEIKRQLNAKIPAEPPKTQPELFDAMQVRRAAEEEELKRMEEQERMQKEVKEQERIIFGMREQLEVSAMELQRANRALAEARQTNPQRSFEQMIRTLGESIGRGMAQAQAMPAGTVSMSASAAIARMPDLPVPVPPKSNGNGEHHDDAPDQAAHEEEEDARLAAMHQAKHDEARNLNPEQPKPRDFGHLPEKFHKKKLAIIGLSQSEQQEIHREFAKHCDLVYMPHRGNTKRVTDLAIQCDAIFTMNQIVPMDFIKAASRGKHFQIHGKRYVQDLAKLLRERFIPEVARHH